MTTTEIGTRSHPVAALIEGGIRQVAALWTAFRNRRSVARLLSWDEHMLRDIGLTQHDVRSALASRVNDDPMRQLGAFARERRAAQRLTQRERRARLD